MILVTAAGGNQGRILIPLLAKAGLKVRALRETAGRDDELLALGASEVMTLDASDRNALERAVEGVRTVYHVGPSAHPREREMGLMMIDAARDAGVDHLIFSSVLHAVASKLIQHRLKRDVEETLIESGLNFTILQPANYMLPLLLWPAFEHGVFELSWALDRRQAMVDIHDIAAVVALVATEGERHYGATYELCAPGCHDAQDIASAVTRTIGRRTEVRQMTPDAYLDRFYGAHGGAGQFRHQYAVFRAISLWYSQYDFVGNANVLRWLLGREPIGLDAFVAREWNARRGSIS